MTSFIHTAAATLALLCATSVLAADSAAPYTEARKAFQEAYAHASDPGVSDSEILKTYPLYPYLQAERIQQAFGSADADALVQADKRAADFMAANGQQPVARNLRRAWLDSLARRSQWNQYLAVYRDAGASDAA